MRTLDTRGMRCPWPAVRLARALRTADADERALSFVADDPRAENEAAAVIADLSDWFISGSTRDGDGIVRLEIRRS